MSRLLRQASAWLNLAGRGNVQVARVVETSLEASRSSRCAALEASTSAVTAVPSFAVPSPAVSGLRALLPSIDDVLLWLTPKRKVCQVEPGAG